VNSISQSEPAAPDSNRSGQGSAIIGAMLRGGGGFAVVSAAGFSVWAFAGGWLHAAIGEAGLFGACLFVFLAGSGLLLHPLMRGPHRFLRFYKIFLPAFFAYAVLWCAAWFALGFGAGEWIASLAGCVAFVAVVGMGFGNYHGFIKVCVVVFICHSAGYFLGGKLMFWLAGPAGSATLAGFSKAQLSLIAKLLWGVLYGLGFGAGMGYAFSVFQSRGNPAAQISDTISQR
jgi:hypothetical protein